MSDTWDCEKCGAEDNDFNSFGDDVTCPICGTVYETDCELSYDSWSFWVTEEKEE
jgi:rubredoxin